MNDAPVPAEPRRDLNPFGSSGVVSPSGALAQAVTQQSVAEVQARMIIARTNPRNAIAAMENILNDCTRPTLAERALYSYARGGQDITGPTIRLAEAIAQRWGNIASGIKEVSRQGGYSECIAYAWDLETGYYDERQFQVRHWRDTQRGGYPLTDERDIYELIANNGQRRKRAVMLAVIPGDVVEAAVNQCEVTMTSTADTSPEAVTKIIDAFLRFDVTQAQLETRIQRRMDSIRPAQVVMLRKIFSSINDGMSSPEDWFSPPDGSAGGVWGQVDAMHNAEQQKAAAGGGTQTQRRAPRKAAAKEAAPNAAGQGTEQGGPGPQQNTGQTAAAQTAGGTPATDQGTSASAGGGTRATDAGVAVGASAPGTSSPNSPGAAFSAFLVDADGIAVDGTDVFTDPVAWATAYGKAMNEMFPPERRGFERANAETLATAHQLEPIGVEAALAPPAPPKPAEEAKAAAPAAETAKGPELPLDAPHDAAVVPKWDKPTRAQFIAYNNTLKAMLAQETSLETIQHIATVNAESINAMANIYRVEAIGIIEARRKELSPPPSAAANGAAPDVVGNLLHDIYSLVSAESVTTWLNMDAIKQVLGPLQTSDKAGWTRVMAAANRAFVKMKVEACKSVEEARNVVSDKMVDGALEWLFENSVKDHDEIVAFSKSFADGLK